MNEQEQKNEGEVITPEAEVVTPEKEEHKKTIDKSIFDKTASELAELKRKYNEKLTDEEKMIELQKSKDEELESLRNEKKIDSLALELTNIGITETKDIAKAMIEGNLIDSVKTIVSAKDAKIQELEQQIAQLKLENMPEPGAGKKDTLTPYSGKTITELSEIANLNPNKAAEIEAEIQRRRKI